MKIVSFILCLTFSISSYAFQDKDININGGVGVFGSRGILGFSAERFFSENHAANLAFGLDLVGATTSFGYRYFGDKLSKQSPPAFFEKCFFIFECDIHFYIGPSLQYAGVSTLKITEGTNEREYKTDPKWFGLISVGSRYVFKNKMTFDMEISYRSIITGGQATQTSGLSHDDQKSIELGYRAVGVNIGLGYLF